MIIDWCKVSGQRQMAVGSALGHQWEPENKNTDGFMFELHQKHKLTIVCGENTKTPNVSIVKVISFCLIANICLPSSVNPEAVWLLDVTIPHISRHSCLCQPCQKSNMTLIKYWPYDIYLFLQIRVKGRQIDELFALFKHRTSL